MLNLADRVVQLRHTRWLQLILNRKSVDSVNVTSLQTGQSVVGEPLIKSWIVSQFLILSITSIKNSSLGEWTEILDSLASTILMFIFLKCIRPLNKNLKTFFLTTEFSTFIKFLHELSRLIIIFNIFSNFKRSHQYLNIGKVMLSHGISFKLFIILSNKSNTWKRSFTVSNLASIMSFSESAISAPNLISNFGSFSKREHAERISLFRISSRAEFNRSIIADGFLKNKNVLILFLKSFQCDT